jgi:two-component system response regulator (stage 0 sporulation protein A)
MIRVFQLDQDTTFLRSMEEHCRRISGLDYQGTPDASALRSALAGDKPDIVLLDLDITPHCGCSILVEIRSRFASDEVKVILLASEEISESTLVDTARLGADYVMERPVDIIVLETRIRQLVGDPLQPNETLTRRQVQEICVAFFEQMGIPPHYKGYRYLVEGIWLATLNPAWLGSVTKHLYPAIAQRFEVNASQVERSMRYALDMTWEKGHVEQLYTFFPYVRESKGKPTNSAFIATMVDLVALATTHGV